MYLKHVKTEKLLKIQTNDMIILIFNIISVGRVAGLDFLLVLKGGCLLIAK